MDRQRDGDVICVQVVRFCAYEDSGGDGSGELFGVRDVLVKGESPADFADRGNLVLSVTA